MKDVMRIPAILVAAVCLAGVAVAGSKYTGTGNVAITRNADGSGAAMGYLGHIYNGPGMKQWIGCQRDENDNVMCHAIDEAYVKSVICTVRSPVLAQSVSSISPDARVTFYWNAQGVCTRIQVVHSSEYQDKQG
jgi:hypothetical protein